MKKAVISIMVLAFLAMPLAVLADGMVIAPPTKVVYETDQKAVIFHEDGLETLVLSITFRGDAQDFAWVVPTPSRPQVDRSTDDLFESLDELTRVEYDYKGSRNFEGVLGSAGSVTPQVTVVETKKVAYYDITVLEANNARALQQWLENHDYSYPSSGIGILNDYIKMGWYFTAVKIDASKIYSGASSQLRNGHAVPLSFTFPAKKIVYPMRISSIIHDPNAMNTTGVEREMPYPPGDPRNNSGISSNTNTVPRRRSWTRPTNVGVMLYIFTDSKQKLANFNTEYAGWITNEKTKKLATLENGQPWIRPTKDKYFLTKLYRSMPISQMRQDLFPTDAANNQTVNYSETVKNSPIRVIILFTISAIFSLIFLLILLFYGKIKIIKNK